MTTSPENAIYTVLRQAVESVQFESALNETDVQPTTYAKIENEKTIRVGNCESKFAPVGESVKEINADITLQILVRVEDKEDPECYPPARDAAWAITIEMVKSLLANPTLDGAVCDLLIHRAFRGWARVDSAIFAVSLLPVRMNPMPGELE